VHRGRHRVSSYLSRVFPWLSRLGENRKLEGTALFRHGRAFALERRINRDTRQARERHYEAEGGEKEMDEAREEKRERERERESDHAHLSDVYKAKCWFILDSLDTFSLSLSLSLSLYLSIYLSIYLYLYLCLCLCLCFCRDEG